jgi:hypothetical protein
MSDVSCAVFARRDLNLDSDALHRFVVGEDPEPRVFAAGEAEEELGDAFATQVLLKGTFPATGEAAIDAIKQAVADGDPLRDQMSFVLGEGSQIRFDAAAELDRGIRFVVTLGATKNGPPDGPDVLVSVSGPDSPDVELMAWDRKAGGFNFYRAMGDPPAWVFAGNSRHALQAGTRAKGPFESHMSGALLMKELKLPWINWDSPSAKIFASAFAGNDERSTHSWFAQKEPGGAYTFEFQAARPAIVRWSKARFENIAAAGGTVEDPRLIMEHVLGTPTANLLSSARESASVVSSSMAVELPPTFFVDADGLGELGLAGPPQFSVVGNIYAATLEKFDVSLADRNGFRRPGDTHFAFLILERAFEDLVVLRRAIKAGLLSKRLAACLLMTDFPNPVFSDRRRALLPLVPAQATLTNGQSTFSEELATAILAAADATPQDSPEREFAELWGVGEDFKAEFDTRLTAYYGAIESQLGEQAGFDSYFELAESRRQRGRRDMPIFREHALLFAQTSVAQTDKSMRRDGTVV